jgi:spoIIIJ-associated protein
VEWVETTGRTVDEAKDAALDQLGVDEQDAEFEIVDEPRTGLFGRLRGEARVRARVRPTQPRPKVERRGRGRRRPAGGGSSPRSGGSGGGQQQKTAVATASESGDGGDGSSERSSSNPRRRRSRGSGSGKSATANGDRSDAPATGERGEENVTGNDATVEEQAAITSEFLSGLIEAFEVDATIREERIDDETIEVHVDGDDLGLLIGPKGNTIQALQELSRTVIQRKATGTHHGRVRIDVAGYRQKRKEALARFAEQVAAQVIESGESKSLEPMHPADRKVVHDTLNDVDGVTTTSEGEEPRRRVVILPASAS